MACCSDPGSCGGDRPLPWLSTLRDPALFRLFLLRYRLELLLGLGAGCLAGAVAVAFGERLGGLGLQGPWLHVHTAVTAPAFLLAGLALALPAKGGWPRAGARALPWLLLGGLANGLLEGGSALSLIAFGLLGLPLLGLAWCALALVSRRLGHPPQAPGAMLKN